jgi:parvulin-like peptidyl-prolyl isomerase
VIRRPLVVSVAVLGLAGLAAGCSTFNQNRVVATVGDAELPRDDFDTLLVASTPGATAGTTVEVAGDTAREVIQTWVVTEILRDEITAGGGSITDEDIAAATEQVRTQTGPGFDDLDPALQELQVEQQAAINVWLELIGEAEPLADDELRAIYELGPTESGITCTQHILVDSEAEALQVLSDLEAGADFAALAAERSTDPGSAEQGGVLPCSATGEFESAYVPEYVEATLAAEIGVPTEPVRSEFGYHVIVVRPFEDVVDEGIAEIYASPQNAFGRAAAAAEVTVDPRYGTFDPTRGVVPLGSTPAPG